ncbi:MAG TPA: hypothetical protein DCR43_04185 [Bacteroidales bacterium]|nr:MAG: hypothetical protein A2X11_01325 [Bacteroidetes bacterium GWE2_42_24]OFY27338.1 MAG: hypothetical protein A2X09_00535 [Bacteroidetes bacterium GWF2_43_11]PKP24257.1 MAG: hypothetical protein CVU06_05135 [Bacteroidetes bacterium HGW-Bacteroidetes-22]HAQ65039.1 hypothetical protein [Bacteroidales bacterium]HBZ65915.1 hypothetical protein [Bacteroidales bacterium]
MKKNLSLLACLLIVLFLSSCDNIGTSGSKATGGTSELLIITDTPEQWQGRVGDSLKAFFNRYVYALPQPEPQYDLLHASIKKFENNPLYISHSTILILHSDKTVTTPTIDVKRNQWASPQVIITLIASSDSALLSAFSQYKAAIDELFKKNQFERAQNLYKISSGKEAEALLKSKFNIDILIPGSFSIALKSNDFLWLRQAVHRKKQDTELGLIFYQLPYRDTAQFGLSHIIRQRDSIGFNYIKGPTDGSYMASSVDVIPPIREVSEDKETGYRAITRGLWMMKKDFMGGPFITYTLYNKKQNKILTAEGYAYNPNGEKRNFMIQLEAILQSIRFSEEPKK